MHSDVEALLCIGFACSRCKGIPLDYRIPVIYFMQGKRGYNVLCYACYRISITPCVQSIYPKRYTP
jgi:hypothetical protein